MQKRALAAATTLTLALSLTACSAGSGTADGEDGGMEKFTVGVIGIGSDAAIQTAIDKGYFAEEGLDVETTVVANPPAGIAAAQSGQLDVAYTPSIPLINALSQNIELNVIAAADGYATEALEDKDPGKSDDTGLFIRPDSGIARARDLAGKKIAVPARKAQLEVTVANMVLKDGGDPASINWMVLDPASSLQSLQQERVDAAGLVAPFTTNAQAEGMKLLGSPGIEFFEAGAVGLWVAGAKQIAEEPESVAGFQRAIYRANAYANEHLDEMDELASEITSLDLETIKNGADPYWPSSVELKDLQRVDSNLVNLGYLSQEVGLDETLIHGAQ
ncbi:sulfonate ABC transporter substrate-binding protein [Arthrobacter sp. MYb211]|uniref:ABC transporter substrate-binding protein n=1 Tax=unclassified Arthrobacter TaxID=235627 RepID=UPI000CFC6660|nr:MULTISPECIES: ABC transporter substrate-binding protein [unclassified Arthrobacter]PRA10587.1 sulfonate ABC transporter substrate-binding protein [Arthrobacter sp. MYb221]PRC06275.1 sulfonate ABC transporter substrate-binding protein [Arthrobacter sp. MYb211]